MLKEQIAIADARHTRETTELTNVHLFADIEIQAVIKLNSRHPHKKSPAQTRALGATKSAHRAQSNARGVRGREQAACGRIRVRQRGGVIRGGWLSRRRRRLS